MKGQVPNNKKLLYHKYDLHVLKILNNRIIKLWNTLRTYLLKWMLWKICPQSMQLKQKNEKYKKIESFHTFT